MDFTNYNCKGSLCREAKYVKVKDFDGQSIQLGFSLQYKLKRDQTIKLYARYQTTYEEKWSGLIR